MKCVILQKRFSSQYRVAHEESYYAERHEHRRTEEPWLKIIPCRHGHVYPQGGDLLVASTDRRGAVAKALLRLPGVRLLQDGDDGANVAFHVDDFAAVAAVMKPRRRRQVSEEERKRLAGLSARHGFCPWKRISQDDFETRPCVPMGRDDLEAVPNLTTAV